MKEWVNEVNFFNKELNDVLVGDERLSIETSLVEDNGVVISILIFGSEAWTLQRNGESRLKAVD